MTPVSYITLVCGGQELQRVRNEHATELRVFRKEHNIELHRVHAPPKVRGCAALIDSMRIVIYSNDQSEQKPTTSTWPNGMLEKRSWVSK